MRNITIIGTGYVGLVSGGGIADFGHHVTCVDIEKEKISQLNEGKIPIYEPGLKDLIDRNINAKRLSFSIEIGSSIEKSDVIFIAVGTPESEGGQADLSSIFSVARKIANHLNDVKVICTKSTVPIGTGKEIMEICNLKFKTGLLRIL